MPYTTPQVALNAQPQDTQKNLDVAHVLENLSSYYRLLLIPAWTTLTAEAGGGAAADSRRVRFELRRASRTAVPALTPVGGDVVDNTCAIDGTNDPAPDGTVGNEANYQETGLRVHFFCSGSGTIDAYGGGVGTEVSGGDTNHLVMLSGTPGAGVGQVVDIEVTDTAAETITVWGLVEGMPTLRNIPLTITFA